MAANLKHFRNSQSCCFFVSSSGGITNSPQGNSFEVYNPINDKWKFLSPPTIPRSRHAMVATETHIYVIGGEGQGIEPEISMERYDPAVNLWSFVLPMNCGKVAACAVELEGKIYVMGGNNGYTTLRQCEVYDVETHQWSMAKGKMEKAALIGKRSCHKDDT